ncbi:cytochrome c maturation protein CcmE [Tatumella ptyseos]|uniref:cytochrome c maturation protein CcmE n=1 Tax=Tatumella ptyseos TaxID=82987 RepID=UPI0023F2C98A|nr:cytochrome c maturation protein CcmE [Tatumella ptyseos]
MNIRRRRRLMVVVAILVGLGLATALVMYALRSNIDLFYTPSEILYGRGADHVDKPHPGQQLRIGGIVMPGSVKRDPDTLAVQFKLYDANGVVGVTYVGILPDLFREGQGIVAEGILEDGNVIKARQVLAKHDAKYTPPEITNAMKKNPDDPALNMQTMQGEQQ